MLTYKLLNTQGMLLSETSRNVQSDADLQTVQNPEHAPVRNMQECPAKCQLTCYSKPRAFPSQQQAGTAIQRLTYILFKIQSMLHHQQARKVSQMLTYKLFKTQRCFSQQQAERASQMLAYNLCKTQGMILSKTSRKCQPDADSLPVQNPEYAPVSNKHGRPAKC